MRYARAALPALFIAFAFTLSAPRPARGQVPDERSAPGERAALAEALFLKGKALMSDQRFEEACPMLAESQRIDPGGGTLLTLALCHERQGKTATAWTELKDAHARAVKDGEPDREAVAKEHLAALEPKLSRLNVRIAPAAARTRGLTVRFDGLALERPAWGLAAPVDPGPHRVEASAPGKRPWALELRVSAERAEAVVDVPALEDEISQAVAARPSPRLAPSRGPRPRTVVGVAVLGVGAVSFGVGAGYGILALVKQSDANKRCPTSSCSDGEALRSNATARSAAVVADVAVPLGLVAGGAGAVLLATAPRVEARKPQASLRVGIGAGGGVLATLDRPF